VSTEVVKDDQLAKMIVSSSPHMFADVSISKIMWTVVIALLPAVIFAVYYFGMPALQTLAVGSLSAVVFEAITQKILKKKIWVVSLVRNFVNPKVRAPIYITSIATIVTVVELLLRAFSPVLYKALGIYLSLIVVFAIILARAEVFASKNTPQPSLFLRHVSCNPELHFSCIFPNRHSPGIFLYTHAHR
jgi:Na+-translocating ferredoxin:NAD+ oxidoreductase RnfE subunit